MLEQVKDVRQKIEVILNLLHSIFDTAKTAVQGYLNRETWLITHTQLQTLMTLLDN